MPPATYPIKTGRAWTSISRIIGRAPRERRRSPGASTTALGFGPEGRRRRRISRTRPSTTSTSSAASATGLSAMPDHLHDIKQLPVAARRRRRRSEGQAMKNDTTTLRRTPPSPSARSPSRRTPALFHRGLGPDFDGLGSELILGRASQGRGGDLALGRPVSRLRVLFLQRRPRDARQAALRPARHRTRRRSARPRSGHRPFARLPDQPGPRGRFPLGAARPERPGAARPARRQFGGLGPAPGRGPRPGPALRGRGADRRLRRPSTAGRTSGRRATNAS